MYYTRLWQIHCPEPAGYQKSRPTTNIINQLPAWLLRKSDFSSPAIVSLRLAAHIYNLSTCFQYTVASYTPHIPSVKADNVSSVTRVTLANQWTGRPKSYIKSESVACQFCRQTVHANYRPSYSVCTHRKCTYSNMLMHYKYELFN